jgi:hypothetical protein
LNVYPNDFACTSSSHFDGLITVAAAEVNNGFTMDQIKKIAPEELLELRIRLFITGFLHAHLVSWSYQPQQIVPNAATDDSHSHTS